jgi:hypothetical protein
MTAKYQTYEPTDRLLTPTKAVEYLKQRYDIVISVNSLYTMISRGGAPKVTYFRGRPKFIVPDIDDWVQKTLSDHR